MESLQKRLEKNNKKKLEKDELNFLEECKKLINDGKKPDELREKYNKDIIKKSALLSLKPRIIVCNVDEKSLPDGNKYSDDLPSADLPLLTSLCWPPSAGLPLLPPSAASICRLPLLKPE